MRRGPEPASPSGGAGAPGTAGTAGTILELVRNGHAATRGDLASLTGLARSTIAQRVDALLASLGGGDEPAPAAAPAAEGGGAEEMDPGLAALLADL